MIEDKEIIDYCLELSKAYILETYQASTYYEIRTIVNESWNIFIRIGPKRGLVAIFSENPLLKAIDEVNKDRCLDFVTKTNEVIDFGTLNMDYDLGVFQYKTCQLLIGVEDPKSIIKFMLDKHYENFPAICESIGSILSEKPTNLM